MSSTVKKKKQTKLNISTSKSQDIGNWYAEVLKKSDMIRYYDVAGCYVLLPWCYSVWEVIQRYMDDDMKSNGVENCYFPLFVSRTSLETEAEHLSDFSPEVAWVTKAGSSDLEEPIAIRPTSETIMYPAYSDMIRNVHDLPIKYNQWTNIVRWEFSKTTPLLRSREFLWQEGHSAHATRENAEQEVVARLDLYARVYEDILAVPVIKGRKSDKEKFAGSDFTTTVEAYIPASGRAIQGGTSHCLGQNFSKMFNISYTDDEQTQRYVWQTSYGFTTRSIGVMVMVHGDDKGLVNPPRASPIQVVVIPITSTKSKKEDSEAILKKVADIEKDLKVNTEFNGLAGIRTKLDIRKGKTAGWKYNYWEQKGVPIRIELGEKELVNNEACVALRHSGEKFKIKLDENFASEVNKTLVRVQSEMLEKARKERDSRISIAWDFEEFVAALGKGNMVLVPWCLSKESEEWVKEETKRIFSSEETDKSGRGLTGAAKSLCIPFFQADLPEGTKCFSGNGSVAKKWCLFGRSY